MNRRRTLLARALAGIALLALSSTALYPQSAPNPEVLLPGGAPFFERALGPIRLADDEIVASINRILLDTINRDHEWERVEARKELDQLLIQLSRLRTRLGAEIVLDARGKEGRKGLQRLGESLGYQVKLKRGHLEVLSKEDEDAQVRQRLGAALGWDVTTLDLQLERGPVTLRFEDHPATSPLDGRQLESLGVDSSELLRLLIRDQRLSLLAEGQRRLSGPTRDLVSGFGWERVRRRAEVFFRYASAFTIDEASGSLALPGGAESQSAWREVLRTDTSSPEGLLSDLLEDRKGRGAYLLHSLSFVPEATVQFYLGAGLFAGEGERSLGRRVFNRLDDSSQTRFDRARGGEMGFGVLVRSLRMNEDRSGLDLAGSPGLWYTAIRAGEPPTSLTAVSELARRAGRNELDDQELLLRSLTEWNKVRGTDVPALPRLIRAANMFVGQPDLLTPENVLLLARSSDASPAALAPLDTLRFSRPEPIRDFLVAVAHLGTLDREIGPELLLVSFQGGVEWLRLLSLADKVPALELERWLQQWSQIHLSATQPQQVAGRQLEWIATVLRGLPEAPEGAPGEGRYERALFAAMTQASDPQRFRFQELEYQGERARQLATSMLRRWREQGIPSPGLMVSIANLIVETREAIDAGDLEQTKAKASKLLANLDSLSEPSLELDRSQKDFAARMLPIDRVEMRSTLEAIGKIRRAERLSRASELLAKAEGLLARELRPFILAPSYVAAMGDEENVTYEQPDLIRKHLLFAGIRTELATDNPWLTAKVVQEPELEIGAFVRGTPGRLPLAFVELSQALGAGRFLRRDRSWFQDALDTRWQELTPEVTRLAHLFMEIGAAIARSPEGELSDSGSNRQRFLSKRIPVARLERRNEGLGSGLFSPSDLLMLGLASIEGDDLASSPPLLSVPSDLRSELEALLARLGDGWRSQLNGVGAATPRLNGRSSRWVGRWPPYEMVENESTPTALHERLLLDLRCRLVHYLGRYGLPGELGADLMLGLLRSAGTESRIETARDWEEMVRWVTQLQDSFFDNQVRELLTRGLYVADL